MSNNHGLTRRRAVRAAAGLGGSVAVIGIAGIFEHTPVQAQLQDANDSVQTILNLAATAEALAITAYYHMIAGNPLKLDTDTIMHLKLALTAEQYHISFLQSAGADVLATSFYLPDPFFSDRKANAETMVVLETAFAAAYLAATGRFAELGLARLAATTAQHAASEVEHLALIRLIAGNIPNPNGLPPPVYYNVSDAVLTLVPFIQGGSGFSGPIGLPGATAVAALAETVQAVRVPTFTQVF